jgi:hypothetical protein
MTKRSVASLLFPMKDKKAQEILDEFGEFRSKCLTCSRRHLGEDNWEDFEDYLEEGWQMALEELIESETKIGRFANPSEIFSGCVTAHTAMVMSRRKAVQSGSKYNAQIHQHLQEYGEEMLKAYRELT